MPISKRSLVKCKISRAIGFDGFGQPKFSDQQDIYCAIVKHEVSTQQSTVRADSSSTKGHAYEDIANFIGLFQPNEIINKEDVLEALGAKFRIIGIHTRLTVTGKLDHYEVKGVIHG